MSFSIACVFKFPMVLTSHYCVRPHFSFSCLAHEAIKMGAPWGYLLHSGMWVSSETQTK